MEINKVLSRIKSNKQVSCLVCLSKIERIIGTRLTTKDGFLNLLRPKGCRLRHLHNPSPPKVDPIHSISHCGADNEEDDEQVIRFRRSIQEVDRQTAEILQKTSKLHTSLKKEQQKFKEQAMGLRKQHLNAQKELRALEVRVEKELKKEEQYKEQQKTLEAEREMLDEAILNDNPDEKELENKVLILEEEKQKLDASLASIQSLNDELTQRFNKKNLEVEIAKEEVDKLRADNEVVTMAEEADLRHQEMELNLLRKQLGVDGELGEDDERLIGFDDDDSDDGQGPRVRITRKVEMFKNLVHARITTTNEMVLDNETSMQAALADCQKKSVEICVAIKAAEELIKRFSTKPPGTASESEF
ncbi:hypothetical protein AAMO2058_000307900 [Amorphochlora amoebiformis]